MLLLGTPSCVVANRAATSLPTADVAATTPSFDFYHLLFPPSLASSTVLLPSSVASVRSPLVAVDDRVIACLPVDNIAATLVATTAQIDVAMMSPDAGNETPFLIVVAVPVDGATASRIVVVGGSALKNCAWRFSSKELCVELSLYLLQRKKRIHEFYTPLGKDFLCLLPLGMACRIWVVNLS